MLAYMILRIVYGTYIVVAALLLYRMVSRFIFHPDCRTAEFLVAHTIFLIIWPISLFSTNGRSRLIQNLPFLMRRNR